MSARPAHPSVRATAAAFAGGLLLGAALVAPVLPSLAARLPSPASFGPVGGVLTVSLLAIVAFVFGLLSVYFGFFLVDDG